MDPDADNYNALANVADSCVYTQAGINTIKSQAPIVTVSPNPSNGNTSIFYYIPPAMVGTAHILFTDLLGRTISDISLSNSQGNILYQSPAKGVYIYYLQCGEQLYSRKKLIIF